jgi:hypothetical protein
MTGRELGQQPAFPLTTLDHPTWAYIEEVTDGRAALLDELAKERE